MASSLLFRSMIIHGFTPNELLTSTVISIRKDKHAHIIYAVDVKSSNYFIEGFDNDDIEIMLAYLSVY